MPCRNYLVRIDLGEICDSSLSESEKLPSAIVVDGDQRPGKVLIMN